MYRQCVHLCPKNHNRAIAAGPFYCGNNSGSGYSFNVLNAGVVKVSGYKSCRILLPVGEFRIHMELSPDSYCSRKQLPASALYKVNMRFGNGCHIKNQGLVRGRRPWGGCLSFLLPMPSRRG